MKSVLILTFILFSATTIAQPIVQNLGGSQWSFRLKDNPKWRPANVPGTVHTDLISDKSIPDPFYRDNERKVQWVSNLDWEYKLEFTPDPVLLAKPAID
ncbi:MAG TPA: hypothetical protein PK509_13220, partial [Catalimonadaceae bacterium]|nr:hypothetical protein [Catalimonadaceae bacterium]